MALTLSRLHKITQSTLYAHGALKLYNQLMDFGRCIDCNQLLGINYNLVGEYNLATECFHSILRAADSHKHPEVIMGKTYHNLGNVYYKLEQYSKSIVCLHQALHYKVDDKQKTITLYLLAKVYFIIGNKDAGKKWLEQGMASAEVVDNRDNRIKLNILQSQWITEDSQHSFRNNLKIAIDYFDERDPNFAFECTALLADSFAKSFHYKEAYETLYHHITHK